MTDEAAGRERCGLAFGHEREAETALERAKREIRRLREEFAKPCLRGGEDVPSQALDSYRAELRDAGENVDLLKMCAAGAIAHAQMVEYEAAEMRTRLTTLGEEPPPPVEFARRIAGYAYRYGQEKMRGRVLTWLRDHDYARADEIETWKPESAKQ